MQNKRTKEWHCFHHYSVTSEIPEKEECELQMNTSLSFTAFCHYAVFSNSAAVGKGSVWWHLFHWIVGLQRAKL